MVYILKLFLNQEKSILALLYENHEVARVEWQEGRDMGRRLFEGIAKLLRENNVQPQAVSDFVIDSEIPENYTSMRIAETVKKVYTFGVAVSRHNIE